MSFQETDIREWVGQATYQRALGLIPSVDGARVDDSASRDGNLIVVGQVHTSRCFNTTFEFVDDCLYSRCTCKARHNCVHGAALALVARRLLMPPEAAPADTAPPARSWQERLAAFTERPSASPAEPAVYVYRLSIQAGREGPRLLARFAKASNKRFTPTSWFNHRASYGAPASDKRIGEVAERIRGHWVRERYRDSRQTHIGFDVQSLEIPDAFLSEFLRVLALHSRVEDEQGRPLGLHPTCPLRAGLVYEPDAEGVLLRPVVTAMGRVVAPGEVTILGATGDRWANVGEALYPLSVEAEAVWQDEAAKEPIHVPAAERATLERRYLPALAIAGTLFEPPAASPADAPVGVPVPQARLEERAQALDVAVGFLYGDEYVDAEDPDEVLGPPRGPYVRRDPVAEARHREALAAVMPSPGPLEGAAAVAFLDAGCDRLAAAGWRILGRDRTHELRLIEARVTTSMRVASGIDWFDVNSMLTVGNEVVPWSSLKAALQARERYMRLGTGGWARLPDAWLAAQRRLLDRLGLDSGDIEGLGALRVPRHQGPLLDLALEEATEVSADGGWTAFRDRLRTFGGIAEAPLPAGLCGTLRPYQRLGLSYLSFLRDYGLHGILADDMGLGKTVQAAALLAANHPNDMGPSATSGRLPRPTSSSPPTPRPGWTSTSTATARTTP